MASRTGPRRLLGAVDLNEWELRVVLDRAASLATDGDEARPVPAAGPTGDGAASPASERERAPLARRLVVFAGDRAVPPAHILAARRLGAETLSVPLAPDAPLSDAASVLDALGADLVVLNHSGAGVPARLAPRLRCAVVNAGDGARERPPAALALALAIRRAGLDMPGLHVALMGDVAASGLARSALVVLGALGARLRLVAPSTLMPPGADAMGATLFTNADEGIAGAEVVVSLPLRLGGAGPLVASEREHWLHHGPTPERLALEAPDALVLRDDPADPTLARSREPVMAALMLTALGVER